MGGLKGGKPKVADPIWSHRASPGARGEGFDTETIARMDVASWDTSCGHPGFWMGTIVKGFVTLDAHTKGAMFYFSTA